MRCSKLTLFLYTTKRLDALAGAISGELSLSLHPQSSITDRRYETKTYDDEDTYYIAIMRVGGLCHSRYGGMFVQGHYHCFGQRQRGSGRDAGGADSRCRQCLCIRRSPDLSGAAHARQCGACSMRRYAPGSIGGRRRRSVHRCRYRKFGRWDIHTLREYFRSLRQRCPAAHTASRRAGSSVMSILHTG